MSEVRSEILPETNKIYKTKFTYRIDKFLHKLTQISNFDFEIPGLTSCRLEVHPNQRRANSGSKFTKLVLRVHQVKTSSPKPREVRFEIRTSQDIAIWVEKFNLENYGSIEKVKEEFFNHLYLKSYMEEEALILSGVIIVKEMDWDPANDPIQIAETRHKKLVQDIHSLASSGILSDFKFIVEGRELEVHKAILAARSPVFERMFTGSFRESTATKQEVKDVSADTFEEFLYFIYAGDLRNKDFPVEELISVADRYQVADLMKFCELKLLKSINDGNAEKIYRLAQKIHSPNSELKKISFEFLQMKFKRFSIALPDEFIESPERVYQSLDLKRKLESSLGTGSGDVTSEYSESELNDTIPTLSSLGNSAIPSLMSSEAGSERSFDTTMTEETPEDIFELVNDLLRR